MKSRKREENSELNALPFVTSMGNCLFLNCSQVHSVCPWAILFFLSFSLSQSQVAFLTPNGDFGGNF